jgi:ABC-type uncharacterized transport system permease subunit
VIFAIILFVLYTLSAWAMLRSVKQPRLETLAWILILIAIIGHSDVILQHMMRLNGRFSIGLLEAMSLLGWTLAVLACLVSIDKQNRVLGAILLLSAAVGAAMTDAGRSYTEATVGWELTAHILLSMGAAALLFAAAVTAILLVILDRRLRARRIANLSSGLPPLDALEKIMFRLVAAGFGLLTLALITGFVFVTNLFTQNLVQKTVLSLIAWLIFGVLLVGRLRFGWRGRSAVRWTLSGFAILAVAYFGVKFVLEYLFGRHWG